MRLTTRKRMENYSLEIYKLDQDIKSSLSDFLAPAEISYYQNILHETRKLQFLNSRFFLKKKLSQVLNVPASDIDFDLLGEGKLILKNPDSFLDFNISHTDHFMALGYSSKGYIGVDIEHLRKPNNLQDIMKKVFNPDEIRQVNNSANANLSFVKLWSAKEALIKASAGGVFKHAMQVHLDIEGLQVINVPREFGLASDWTFSLFESVPGHIVSVAFKNK